MDDKKVREYYEILSRERDKFIKKAVAQDRHFWSAWGMVGLLRSA